MLMKSGWNMEDKRDTMLYGLHYDEILQINLIGDMRVIIFPSPFLFIHFYPFIFNDNKLCSKYRTSFPELFLTEKPKRMRSEDLCLRQKVSPRREFEGLRGKQTMRCTRQSSISLSICNETLASHRFTYMS